MANYFASNQSVFNTTLADGPTAGALGDGDIEQDLDRLLLGDLLGLAECFGFTIGGFI